MGKEPVRLQFYSVNVFTNEMFEGTQVLVFPNADLLNDATMYKISQEFGFPDTVFITKASTPKSAAKFRLFTRTGESAFEGHATIGAAFVHYTKERSNADGLPYRFTIDEEVGPIDIVVSDNDDQQLVTEFVVTTHPKFDSYVPSSHDLSRILSVDPSSFHADRFLPMVAVCDRAYLIVPVHSVAELQRAKFSNAAWVSCAATSTMPRELLVFAPATPDSSDHFYARLLGESIDSTDDPPIGSAMPAFANYLIHSDINNKRFIVERGLGYSRLSTLHVHIDDIQLDSTTIRVGGSVVLVSEGELNIFA